MASQFSSGGCQCGKVRFRLHGEIADVHLCHCRMCQKAVGNVFATIAVAQKSNVEFIRDQPSWFQSSAHVRRGFCGACGTPLIYADELSNCVGIMAGALDRPEAFPPTRQDGIEGRLGWTLELAGLAEKGFTGAGKDAAWASAIAKSNMQHPDFEK